MTKQTVKPFVMPGADSDDDVGTNDKLDLSFMEPTEEELAAKAAAEERKAALLKEEEDAAEEKRLADEAKAAEAAGQKDVDTKLTDEEKAEAAKLEADRETGKKKNPMVPKSRLDEVLAKNRELLAQVETERKAREARVPEIPKDAQAFDFDAKEAEYMQAVIDGEKAKALELRKEIRAAEKTELQKATATATTQDSEAVALAKAAAEVERSFPQFTHGHEKYNEEATKAVVKMRDALIMQGQSAVEALNDAVDYVVRKFDLDETPVDDSKVVDLNKKREANTAKKIDAHGKQPPVMKGEGERTRKADQLSDIDLMSEEEFNALPEATKRRMRGDFL